MCQNQVFVSLFCTQLRSVFWVGPLNVYHDLFPPPSLLEVEWFVTASPIRVSGTNHLLYIDDTESSLVNLPIEIRFL